MSLQIIQPQDWQVFQQDALGQAVLEVSLTGAPAGSRVLGRLTVLPGYTGVDTDWTALSEKAPGFSGHLLGEAGGWYRLEIKVETPDGKVSQATVPHVGVGEVFICAGQSNAANSGETPQKPEDDRVVAYDGQTWRPGHDPQPGANGTGGSPWPRLGDMLARSLQVPIAFACVAVGGSRSSQWLPPDGELYPRLVNIGKALGRNGARLLLWHQGESDTLDRTSAEEYARRLTVIMQTLDRDLGWHLPWMVAQAAYGFTKDFPEEAQAQVREGQRLLWERGLAFQGPLTDDLIGPRYRADEGGNWIHFNENGLRTHAERWFAMLWAQLYASPHLVPETSEDSLPGERD